MAWSLCLLAATNAAVLAALPWSCDELVSERCELQVHKGQLEIHSIPVTYWRYSARATWKDVQIAPLVALHGGPSWPHNYLLPLKFLACHGVSEVIFYDQAGCGASPAPNGSVPRLELLEPSYYAQTELPELLKHWKLDKYHLLGHSWGTILAQLFALNAPKDVLQGMQSMVLAGPLSDSQSYIRAQWDPRDGNLGSLPPFVQGRIRKLEDEHRYDSPEYQAINAALTTFFTLRTAPAPDCFAFSERGVNRAIYVGMQGASEFTMHGVLGSFNVTGRLHEIQVPVLLTSGRFDTMRPSIVKTMQQQLPKAEWKMFPHSGHVSMIDDAELSLQVIPEFLRRVQAVETGKISVPKVWDGATAPAALAAAPGTTLSPLLPAVTPLALALALGVALVRRSLGEAPEAYARLQ